MSDITVTETLKKRNELAKAIASLLEQFSGETGLLVDSIYFDCSLKYGGTIASYRVDVEVKLP